MKKHYLTLIVLIFYLIGCGRIPIKTREEAMRKSSVAIELVDSLGQASFFEALEKNIQTLKTSKNTPEIMVFGNQSISKWKYIEALEKVLNFKNDPSWLNYIKDNFDFYEVYGNENWGEVFSTGYYEPKVFGSKIPTKEFNEPLYSPPKDLLKLDAKLFQTKFPNEMLKLPTLAVRLVNKKIVPYYDRKEITVDRKLKDQNLELLYLDPIDAFFIEIQGSGVVDFNNGEKIRVGYADQNGYPYVAIGKFLKDKIPLEKMSMQRIQSYLKNLSRADQDKIFIQNPSYVFFQILKGNAQTYSGAEVTEGRTIATDKDFFPKGAMAFLEIQEPLFATEEAIEPAAFVLRPRLVFDQDTGGAIKGPGRMDLFMGSGKLAAQKAGGYKEKGRLFYLFPKK